MMVLYPSPRLRPTGVGDSDPVEIPTDAPVTDGSPAR